MFKDCFDEIWSVDFEFFQPDGERPRPLCMVAKDHRTGRLERLWLAGGAPASPPFDTSASALFVAHYASAEIGCFLELGWPLPVNIIDSYAEFSCMTCGRARSAGRGLLGVLIHFGFGGIASNEKQEMRELAMRGGSYTEEERQALLDYCQTDVEAVDRLLPRMEPEIDLPRALLRGRYAAAVASVERTGVPIDTGSLTTILGRWEDLKHHLIEEVDKDYGVYEGSTFKSERFLAWCDKASIAWPRLESGAPNLRQETFRDMAAVYPGIELLRELRAALSEMRLNGLTIGVDGRNRCLVSPFASKTSRNQPSTTKFVFGPSKWVRSLIQAPPGRALAYIDYGQQELGIAAALSGDENLMAAYRTGDPYLAFAKMAKAVPDGATRDSHPDERNQYKICALGVMMGMGAATLGHRMGATRAEGERLLAQHRDAFPHFWEWSQRAQDTAMSGLPLQAAFGWRIHLGFGEVNPRTLRNFPLQANGAEMLRIAAIAITERDIQLCAMVHDAVLIEAAADLMEDHVAETRRLMAEASKVVLSGFALETDVEIYGPGERIHDERGARMWDTVTRFCESRERTEPAAASESGVSA